MHISFRKKKKWPVICDNGIKEIEGKKLLQLIYENDITEIMKKKSLIFDNDIAEKIVTSIVHCQTFELSRTQLDPSPDMSNCTFKKKRYPF